MFSTPVRLMARPFGGYRELATGGPPPSLIVGAARLLFVVGTFVSISATGRLAPVEALSAMVSFAWLPLAHAIGLAVTLRALARRTSFARAYALYLEGQGAWLVAFLFFSGACLFVPHPARPVVVLLGPVVGIASVWSVVTTFAFFRAGLELARARSAVATGLLYAVVNVFILGYYLAVGQLWPIL